MTRDLELLQAEAVIDALSDMGGCAFCGEYCMSFACGGLNPDGRHINACAGCCNKLVNMRYPGSITYTHRVIRYAIFRGWLNTHTQAMRWASCVDIESVRYEMTKDKNFRSYWL